MATKKTRLQSRAEAYQNFDPARGTDDLLKLLEEDLNDDDQVGEAFRIHRRAAQERLVQ